MVTSCVVFPNIASYKSLIEDGFTTRVLPLEPVFPSLWSNDFLQRWAPKWLKCQKKCQKKFAPPPTPRLLRHHFDLRPDLLT